MGHQTTFPSSVHKYVMRTANVYILIDMVAWWNEMLSQKTWTQGAESFCTQARFSYYLIKSLVHSNSNLQLLFYMIWWYLACQQMYHTSTICDQWLAYYTSQSSKATHVCYRSFEITTNISEHRNKSVCLPTPTTSSHWSVSTAALSSWWLSSSYWAFGSKSINWFELFARCDMLTLPCFLMYSATAFISSVDM